MTHSSASFPHLQGSVQIPLLAFLFMLGLIILPWIFIAVGTFSRPLENTNNLPPDTGLLAEDAVERRTGPWGTLELQPITISPLDTTLPEPSRKLAVSWFFTGISVSQLVFEIESLDLTESQKADLLNTNAWQISDLGIGLSPLNGTILTLHPQTRSRLYDMLDAIPVNEAYYQPWSLRASQFEQALSTSKLNSDVKNIIQQVAYTRGNRVFVSDMPVILNSIHDEEQKMLAIRFLKSTSTYLVSLDVPSGSDAEILAQYWGERGHHKDLRPILHSLSQLPNGGKLDIAHLLPTFARRRLYIYPEPMSSQDGVRRDCHWSSLNFFHNIPDNRFGHTEIVQQHILTHYQPTDETLQFGDLLFFTLPNRDTVHSAVYIAANLVFTKNGDTVSQPWIIMDMDELRDLYQVYYHTEINMQFWQYKNPE